ncbi:MAG: hypothetical protein DWI11_09810 [Planctomycetota bacterium]|nr:MAG: hypothetical protein DWI11_09810 [Planctomycetota bacterium]
MKQSHTHDPCQLERVHDGYVSSKSQFPLFAHQTQVASHATTHATTHATVARDNSCVNRTRLMPSVAL